MTILRWLHQHNRVVVNGLAAAQLENSKGLQYMTCLQYGIGVPRTLLTAKPSAEIIEREFGKSTPFLIKPDRGGWGISIRFYSDVDAFKADSRPMEAITGLYVIQEYLNSQGGVYRAEFVGQRYLYTSLALPESGVCFNPNMCPCELPESRFKILTDFNSHPIVGKLERLFKGTGLDNGGVEFIMDENEEPRVIDINTNTVYSTETEIRVGAEQGWKAVTQFIVNKLKQTEAENTMGDRV